MLSFKDRIPAQFLRPIRIQAAAAALCLLLISLAGCRSAQHYYEMGNGFYQAGKYSEADLNYRKAIQKNVNFGAAVYQLGLTQIKEHQTIDAYETLSRAAALLPNDPAPRISLADLLNSGYLESKNHPEGMYRRIQQLVTEIERLQPNSPDALRIRGTLAISDRRSAAAIEDLRRAEALRPDDPEIVLPLVQALIQNGQSADAEKRALALIARHPEFGPIYNVLYLVYVGANRAGDAENIMRLKVKNNPLNLQAIVELANHYRNTGQPEEATRVLQGALENRKNFPDAPRVIGDYYVEKGIPNRAVAAYQIGIDGVSGDKRMVLQKRMVIAYLADKQRGPAMSMLNDLIRQNPEDYDSKNMKAVIQIDSGDAQEYASGVAMLKDLTSRFPNVPGYHYNLGRAEYRNGKLEDARRELTDNVRLDPSFKSVPARRLLAAISVRQRQYATAVREADEILSGAPNDSQARLVKAVALHGLQDYEAEHVELAALLHDQPNFIGAQVELAYLDIAEKKFKDADAIFHRLYRPGEQDTQVLSGLVDLDVASKQIDQAIQLLNDELKRNPQSIPVRNMLASLYFQSGRLDLALDEYRRLSSLSPETADFPMGIGEVLQAKGDLNAAASEFHKAEALDGKSSVPPALAGSALQTLGRYPEAAKEYRESLRRQPGDPRVLNNLAFILVETGKNLEEALTMALDAQRKMPNQPQFQDTLGWIYLKKGSLDSALQIFENLVRKNPADPTYRYHLAATLWNKGNSEDARKQVEQALLNRPSDAEATEMKAMLARLGPARNIQTAVR